MKKLLTLLCCYWLALGPALAGQITLLGAGGAGVGGADATITFVDSEINISDLLTYTFTAKNFGTATATRRIVAGFITGDNAVNCASATIGGIAATELVDGGAADGVACLYLAAVPTGTSGNVSITFGDFATRAALCLWAVDNLLSDTPVQTGTSTADPGAINLNVSAGGVVMSAVYIQHTGSMGWTGLTEDLDAAFETTRTASCASAAFASAQTPLSIIADFSVAASSQMTTAASLR